MTDPSPWADPTAPSNPPTPPAGPAAPSNPAIPVQPPILPPPPPYPSTPSPDYSSGSPATPAPPSYPAAGFPVSSAPSSGYGTAGYDNPGYASPGYGTPGYGTPGYGTPGYGTPGYGTPGYGAPGYGSYAGYGTQPVYPAFAPARQTNGLAVAAMVVALVGVVLLPCYGFGGLLGLVGAILGHVARRRIRENDQGGDGMALAGVIVGWIVTGLGLVVFGLMVAFVIWSVDNAGTTTYYDLLRLYLG